MMKRREFITLLGGAAVALPLAARAQQRERMRRIGVLMNLPADDLEGQARNAAFLQGLQQFGWIVGSNVRIDIRWGGGDANRMRKEAEELVASAPDVILASGTTSLRPLLQATRTLPVVFANVADPVGAGFVASLAKPGGNATGFTAFEFGSAGKLLELLKEIAPGLTRAGVVRDPMQSSGTNQFAAIQAVAPFLKVEVRPLDAREASQIEPEIDAFAHDPNGGLIVVAGGQAAVHRALIAAAAARHRLPAVYPFRYYVASGGLISYGPDNIDSFRRAAGYVDRILKGANAADLPVQEPVKHELVINLKAARALGLEVPASVLARADEVIE
jgi:putative ABC transport system substrate-binding protein